MPTTTTRPMHVPTTSPLTGNGAAAQDELLRVDNLQVHFPIVQGVFRRQVGTLRAGQTCETTSVTTAAMTTLRISAPSPT